jgi:8-amino-7-oxononanoate synthase
VFGSGYAANMGAIGALVGRGDRVLEDRLNHASLLDGGWLSRAGFARYRHGDMADLRRELDVPCDGRTLVVTDGVFSMDGDACPLANLVALTRGLVAGGGHGGSEVLALMGTLGKAFGTGGAFVAGDDDLVELLIQKARPYIYTTAMPAALAAATLTSLAIADEEEWRRERLRDLTRRFRTGAAELGLALADSATPIQPLVVGDSARALALSAALEAAGILVTPIRPPTVPAGTARLRVTLTAAHESADVDRLLQALAAALHAVPAE